MRLSDASCTTIMSNGLTFANWILQIGDDLLGDDVDGESIVCIPEELLLKQTHNNIDELVLFVYPNLWENISKPSYLKDRSILSTTIDVVASVNNHILSLLHGDEHRYISSDNVTREGGVMESELQTITPDILNSINYSGLPPHELVIKVDATVILILMRNIDQTNGLCNGTRLQVTRAGKNIIECLALTGSKVGYLVLVPRMTLAPSSKLLPFKFTRRQFPLILSFAMTINKSQGQTLNTVGLYLPKPIFTHGQLYVALSRVTDSTRIKILINEIDEIPTGHIFNEVLQGIN